MSEHNISQELVDGVEIAPQEVKELTDNRRILPVNTDTNLPGYLAQFASKGIKSFTSFPLVVKQELAGVMVLGSLDSSPPKDEELSQARMLAEQIDKPVLVSGDLVRRAAEHDQGMVGDVCRDSLSKGHYVADSEMFVMWKARLKDKDTQDGWVIDGFPRNLSQSEWLSDKFFRSTNQTLCMNNKSL